VTRLISVGNVIVDVVLAVPELPDRGGDVVADPVTTEPGGSYNTLVAARRQGLASAYGGGHGTGPRGDLAREALRREGIVVLRPRTPGIDTGYDIALVDGGGERTFVTVFGAEAELSGRHLAGVRPAAGDVVHVSGYGLLARTNAVALSRWLPSVPAGVTVLLDPGPLVGQIARSVWSSVLPRVDWLSCNLAEAVSMSGERDALAAAGALGRPGARVVIRTGADGCVLAVDGQVTEVPGFGVRAVDPTGAGDAHVGIFLAALARGADPIAAARRANAGAAVAVTRPGPAGSPTRDELEAFLRGDSHEDGPTTS